MNAPWRRWLFSFLGFAVLSGAALGAPAPQETLAIKESPEGFTLSVPISQLLLHVPKGGLTGGTKKREGQGVDPRYFFFEDRNAGLIISGWFEPASRFTSTKKMWDSDVQQWKRQKVPVPTEVSFATFGRWDAVRYDLPVPGGSNTHLRAHWVEAGTWIDLHLSLTAPRPLDACRAQLLELLQSIRVEVRK